MARVTLGFDQNTFTTIRTGITSADSATLTDANINPALAIKCHAFDSVFVGAECVGGTLTSITIEPLFRDADRADGSRWLRYWQGAQAGITPAGSLAGQSLAGMDGTVMGELQVFGHFLVFFRVSALTLGGATSVNIVAKAGLSRDTRGIGIGT